MASAPQEPIVETADIPLPTTMRDPVTTMAKTFLTETELPYVAVPTQTAASIDTSMLSYVLGSVGIMALAALGGGDADDAPPTPPSAPKTLGGVSPLSITNDPSPQLTLRATAGSIVKVFDNDIQIGTATEGPAGTFTFTPSADLAEGAHSLTFVASNAFGSSPESEPLVFTIDTLPPAAGVLAITGKDNDADGTFTLVPSGAEAGASVVLQKSTDGGATWTTTTAAQTLAADGTVQYRALVTDAAGNSAPTAAVSASYIAPTPPVFTSAASGGAAENQASLYTAAATDGDGAVTYSLKSGGDAALLSIDAATGAVTLASGTLDFEGGKTSYGFTVIAADTLGAAAERAVSIAVTDLADSPPRQACDHQRGPCGR